MAGNTHAPKACALWCTSSWCIRVAPYPIAETNLGVYAPVLPLICSRFFRHVTAFFFHVQHITLTDGDVYGDVYRGQNSGFF